MLEPWYTDPYATLYQGYVLDVLDALPAESAHSVVTSPPYFGLRSYGTPPLIWGGDPVCQHEWGQERILKRGHPGDKSTLVGTQTADLSKTAGSQGQFCQRCGGWRGDLGLEPVHDCNGAFTGVACGSCYVCHLVEVFRGVWRVLRKDGTLWLNLGDSYNAGTRAERQPSRQGADVGQWLNPGRGNGRCHATSLKPKDLCGLPWRVALALQQDGWYLRSAITLCKLNPMPESCTDRPISATEMMFLLTKAATYYYDSEAVKEKASLNKPWANSSNGGLKQDVLGNNRGGKLGLPASENGRNLRNWWPVTSEPFPDAHFATFGTKWIEPCIKAGTSERGCCRACGSPYVRVVSKEKGTPASFNGSSFTKGKSHDAHAPLSMVGIGERTIATHTTGWRPSCSCPDAAVKPCTVLDPFVGSGTTVYVAKELHRKGIGIDLNADYLAMGRKRLRQEVLPFQP